MFNFFRKLFFGIFGLFLSLKRIKGINFKYLIHEKYYASSKGKILIASNTTSATTFTNLELYFSKIFKKNKFNVFYFLSDGEHCASLWEKERLSRFNTNLNDIKLIESIPCKLISNIIYFIGGTNSIRFRFWPKLLNNEIEIIDQYIYIFKNSLKKEKFLKYELHEYAISGFTRYLGKTISFKDIYLDKDLFCDYLQFVRSACITALTWEKILNEIEPNLLILNHGLYVPQGIILEVAKSNNIKVKTFHPGYRKNSLIIGDNDTYHKTLVKKDVSEYLNIPISSLQKQKIQDYLYSRRFGYNDQISFIHKNAEKLNLPEYIYKIKPFNLILTNVAWDAQCHYENNQYNNMNDWILDIIELARKYSNTNFVFRCHPAEVNGRRVSNEKTSDFIYKNSKNLKNIYIVKSEDKYSTYKLLEESSAVIVYATKTAIEAACLGKPVLICGESFLRNKGIGLDLKNCDDIENTFLQLNSFKVDTDLAYNYAYHFFFREMGSLPKLNSNDYLNEQMLLDRFLS